MSDPKISIIVPVYNVERYLRQCIDSILAQTYRDFELFLVDDGSPDNSGKICDEYARKDLRIHVFHKPNGGVSSARNLGIDNAKGEYISFIDADDYIEPNFAEEMVKAMEGYDADLVCCGVWMGVKSDGSYSSIRSTDSVEQYNRKDALIEALAFDSFHIWSWNKLYKARIIKDNALKFPIEISYGEDRVFVLGYIMHCSKTVYIPSVLYCFVCNETSATALKRKFDHRFLTDLKASDLSYDIVKTLHNKAVMSALKSRLFLVSMFVADRFLLYYDGTDKETLRLLRRNLTKYFPYYFTNERCCKVFGRRNAFRLMFRVYFPTLHKVLYKTKKKIKHAIHYVKE